MKVTLWKIKFTLFLLFVFSINQSQSQTIDRKWIADRIDKKLERKINITEEQAIEIINYQNSTVPSEVSIDQTITTRNESNQNVSNTSEAESEIAAAINPFDQNNIIVSAMKWTPGILGDELSFPVYYTHDFGETWNLSSFADNTQLPDFAAGGGDPVLSFSANGDAHLTWLIVSFNLSLEFKFTLKHAISTDGGATWSIQPDPLDEGIVGVSNIVDKEWIASDISDSPYSGNVYAVYALIDPVDTLYQIGFKTKTPDNPNFSDTPVILNPPNMDFSQFSSIDVDDQGHVHVIFVGAYYGSGILGLYHTKSIDGGQSFSALTKISDLHIPCFSPDSVPCEETPIKGVDSTRVYSCNHLRIDKSGQETNGNLYVTWTADGTEFQETEGVDIYFSKSEDGGLSWSDPIIINTDNNPQTNNFYSSLAVNPMGQVILSWYDCRADANNTDTEYYMVVSEDGGTSFSDNFPISTASTDFSTVGLVNNNFGIGEYNEMVASSDYAIPFWSDGRGNDGNLEIYAAFVPFEPGPLDVESIKKVSRNLSINKISPNPASEEIEIVFSLISPSDITASIINIEGKVIKDFNWKNVGANQHIKKLQISDLPEGTYSLTLKNASDLATTKFLIAR